VNAAGDYLIADTGDHRIREVSALTSILSTVAGSGISGFSGDNGAATNAELNQPTGITVDAAGDLYISDTGNNRLRMVLAGTGKINTLAGGGTVPPASNPTSAPNASLSSPSGITVASDGTLYFSNTGGSVLEKLGSPSLTFATPTTVNTTDTADGPQTVSLLNIGNVALTAVSPGISVPSDFTQLTGNAGDCTSTFSLQSGTACNLRIQFAPQNIGQLSESLIITDNALGASSSTQTIALSGTGRANAPTITLSPATVPSATVGSAYLQSLLANGGTSPYTYAVTGSLPPGLSFSNSGVLSGTPTTMGTYNFTITATDTNAYSGAQTYSLSVQTGTASVTLGGLNQTYTGSPVAATATTNPAGLIVSLKYNGSSTPPTAAGTYSVVATVTDPNYQGTATGTLVIGKATASVTLNNLNQTYTGSPLSATATTNPAGLAADLTYDGSATAPTAPGTYNVVATISDSNYQGTATGTLTIAKATASVTLNNLNQTYTGSPLSATATTNPAGLGANLTYNGSATPPTAPGTYNVVATIADSNYQGTATGTLTITKATASVTLNNLNQTYTGSPLSAAATTNPAGLGVNFTYNGSATAPTAAGTYTVVATINDADYQGTTTGSLVIGQATASVKLSNLNPTYTGSAIAVAATTVPAGLSVNLTYNGSSMAPTAVGTYTVVAAVNDPNYQGSTGGTLVIAKAQSVITWPSPVAISYGTPLSSQQLNAEVDGVAGTFVYSPGPGTTLSAGANQTLSVTFTPADPTNYGTLTKNVLISVNRSSATVSVAADTTSTVVQNPITLRATISHTAAFPTGTVTFVDGTTPLGTSNVTSGVAIFTTSTLSSGAHTVTAIYSGDQNYTSSTSSAISENVLDFGISSTQNGSTGSTGTTGGGDGSTPSQTVLPGGTATYNLSIAPTAGETLPVQTVLTVSGLPSGATASLLSAGWIQATSTSWILPAYAPLQDVSLSFHVPGLSAALREPNTQRPSRGYLPAVALCLLLMPVGTRARHLGKLLNRKVGVLLILVGLAFSTFGLTGCGTRSGFFNQAPKSYVVTVTITAGTVSRSTNLNLTVQ
jgi:hypothetical protein